MSVAEITRLLRACAP